MTFLSVPDKTAESSTYPPSVLLESLLATGWTPGTVPDSVLCTYARFELYLATHPDLYTPNHMLGTGPNRFFLVNSTDGRVAVNCLGIGAPAVVAQMELQAELGVRRFVSIGTAGGLQVDMVPGDITVVTSAVRDEGTSYHYLAPGEPALPDPTLTDGLAAALTGAGLDHRLGATVTTDAPNRITASEVRHHRSEGAVNIEMEASAVFAAAQVIGVQSASALVADGVADDDVSWHLDLNAANAKLQQVFAASVDFLGSLD